jgi:hypothetical protein
MKTVVTIANNKLYSIIINNNDMFDKSLMKQQNFIYWLFESKDVDVLIIAIIISTTLDMFIRDISAGVVKPIITGILHTNDDDEQILKIYNFEIKFKLQLIVSGFLKATLFLWITYLTVKYFHKKKV